MKTITIDDHVMLYDSTDNHITLYELLSENAIGNLEHICDCRLYKKVEELNI